MILKKCIKKYYSKLKLIKFDFERNLNSKKYCEEL